MQKNWDLIIIGAGTAGIPASIFAAQRTDRILLIDVAPEVGGTLHLSSGQMSAAGTKLQAKKGIKDSAELHLQDIIRISKGTANYELSKIAVENASDTLDWLESLGFEPLSEHPVKGQAHEPYSVERYVWGEEKGVSILKALLPKFQKVCDAGKVDLRLNTRVDNIITDKSGNILGVNVIKKSGGREKFYSNKILIASGGYVANKTMYEQLTGHQSYGEHSYPYCIGDSIALAENLNAQTWGHENYLTSFGSVMATYDIPSKIRLRPIHWPERRMPWEIYVNQDGKRFIREDEPSVDVREHSILKQPNLRHWIIFDSEILKMAPSLFPDFSSLDIDIAATNKEPMFYKSSSIHLLAEQAGIESNNLEKTVNEYNLNQSQNNDSFNRTHMPRQIITPPFYAIRSQAMSVSSTVGLKVNSNLTVIDDKNNPINGLYAAGEALGSGALMGSSFCGGMLVTPAITFGRLLGEKLISLN